MPRIRYEMSKKYRENDVLDQIASDPYVDYR